LVDDGLDQLLLAGELALLGQLQPLVPAAGVAQLLGLCQQPRGGGGRSRGGNWGRYRTPAPPPSRHSHRTMSFTGRRTRKVKRPSGFMAAPPSPTARTRW